VSIVFHFVKIGLFGGSFDPVHLGHLLVAQAAREELSLDRIVFIPAAQSPFKPLSPPLAAMERLRLLRLALAGETDTQIDTQELERGGVSYTIDTLRYYAQKHPEAELYYMIGADHAGFLPQWHSAQELARLTQFVVIPRPGGGGAVLPQPFRGQALEGYSLAVSSSQIRARVRQGQRIDHLVPPAVAEAIRNYRLYL
jgi:nicotinate-nucleotide adenylyltransferase